MNNFRNPYKILLEVTIGGAQKVKIRKANMQSDTYTVYIHENKKEEQTLVAIPDLQWSTIIPYEENKATLTKRLTEAYTAKLNEEEANHLALKLVQWVSEM